MHLVNAGSATGHGDGKEAINPSLGGKADQDMPPVVEARRFLEDGVRAGTFDGASMPAFRIASHGNTKGTYSTTWPWTTARR